MPKTKQPKPDSLTQFSSAIKRKIAYFAVILGVKNVSVYRNYYVHVKTVLDYLKSNTIVQALLELIGFLLTLTGLIHAKVHKEKKRKEKKRIYGTS